MPSSFEMDGGSCGRHRDGKKNEDIRDRPAPGHDHRTRACSQDCANPANAKDPANSSCPDWCRVVGGA